MLWKTVVAYLNNFFQFFTRIYLILLFSTSITIALVTWLRIKPIIITVEHLSQTQFQSLLKNKCCPCSKMSILYNSFLNITPRFYQIYSASMHHLLLFFTIDKSFQDFYMNGSSIYRYSAVQSWFALNAHTVFHRVKVGCYIIESMFQSTFECIDRSRRFSQSNILC